MKSFGRMLLAGLAPLLMHGSLLTGNLLTNPGAETGNLTGWTAAGGTGAGVDSGSFDPGINPRTGSFDFYGGVGNGNPLGTLSQTNSIVTGSVTGTLIDTGTLFADVSFWEQSLNQGAPSVGGGSKYRLFRGRQRSRDQRYELAEGRAGAFDVWHCI